MTLASVIILLTFLSGTVAAQCPPGYAEVGGECFFFEDDVTWSFSAGQLLCELQGGRLAFVGDCQLLSDVVLYIEENGLTSSPGYWLGGTDLRVEGKFEWFNGDPVPMGTPFWGASEGILEPSGGETQNCLAMNAVDGYFFGDFACDLPLGVLCQPAEESNASTSITTPEWRTTTPTWWTSSRYTNTPTWWTSSRYTNTNTWWTSSRYTRSTAPSTTSETTSEPARCPDGFEFVSSRCLMFLDDVTDSWSTGELRCQLIDAHLAMVDGCHQLEEVVEYIVYMGYSPYQGFWLGATDLQVEGRFEWISGAEVSQRMPLWGKEGSVREPSGGEAENCLAMIAADRYYFHDRLCADTMGVICEVPPIGAETTRQERLEEPNKI